MPQEYDATGIKEPGDFSIPEAEYTLTVTNPREGKSNNGDYQVKVDLVVDGGEHKGYVVKNHRVTFFPPGASGAGFALSFLKSINQPYQGKFVVDPAKWEKQRLLGYLVVDEYQGRKNMKVSWVKPLSESTDAPF